MLDPDTATSNTAGPASAFADTFYLASFVVFIASIAFEGPLRLGLIALHLPFAIYLREVLAAGVIAHVLLSRIRANFITLFIMTIMLIVHNLVGFWMTNDLRQVLFGDKIVLDGLFGLAISPFIYLPRRRLVLFLMLVLIGTDLGILFNLLVDPLPWQDMSVDVAGLHVTGVRTDYAGGMLRLAGFSRAYSEAASIEVLLSMMFIVMVEQRVLRIAILLLCIPFLFLTNSKASFVCLFIAAAPFILGASSRILKAICIACIGLVVAIPLGFVGIVLHVPEADTFSLFSFVDRVNRSWPNSWNLIEQGGSLLLGRGIGGIGSPQKTFAPALFQAGDNVFLMLYGYFGAFTFVYVLLTTFLVTRADASRGNEIRYALMVMTFIASFGITGVVIEDELMMFYLCAAIGLLYRATLDRRSPTSNHLNAHLEKTTVSIGAAITSATRTTQTGTPRSTVSQRR